MAEDNPYEVSAVTDSDSKSPPGDGSYMKLFLRLAGFSGPIFGAVAGLSFIVISLVRLISAQAGWSEMAGSFLVLVLMSFVVFGMVTAIATMVLLTIGFVAGLIVDVVLRLTRS